MFRSTKWFIRELERRERVHEEQVNKLLDRIMHLAEKPWVNPPIEEFVPDEPVEIGVTYPEDWPE